MEDSVRAALLWEQMGVHGGKFFAIRQPSKSQRSLVYLHEITVTPITKWTYDWLMLRALPQRHTSESSLLRTHLSPSSFTVCGEHLLWHQRQSLTYDSSSKREKVRHHRSSFCACQFLLIFSYILIMYFHSVISSRSSLTPSPPKFISFSLCSLENSHKTPNTNKPFTETQKQK